MRPIDYASPSTPKRPARLGRCVIEPASDGVCVRIRRIGLWGRGVPMVGLAALVAVAMLLVGLYFLIAPTPMQYTTTRVSRTVPPAPGATWPNDFPRTEVDLVQTPDPAAQSQKRREQLGRAAVFTTLGGGLTALCVLVARKIIDEAWREHTIRVGADGVRHVSTGPSGTRERHWSAAEIESVYSDQGGTRVPSHRVTLVDQQGDRHALAEWLDEPTSRAVASAIRDHLPARAR
jgi:hypothetical protein